MYSKIPQNGTFEKVLFTKPFTKMITHLSSDTSILVPWKSITKIENIALLVPVIFSGWFSDLMKFFFFFLLKTLLIFLVLLFNLISPHFVDFSAVIKAYSHISQGQNGASPYAESVQFFIDNMILRLFKEPTLLSQKIFQNIFPDFFSKFFQRLTQLLPSVMVFVVNLVWLSWFFSSHFSLIFSVLVSLYENYALQSFLFELLF